MNLSAVGKLVAQHSATPEETQRKIQLREREQEIVRCMFNRIVRGIIVLGIGVAMLVCAKNFELDRWFRTLSTLLILAGTGFATYGLLNSMRQGALLAAPTRRTDSLPTVDTKQFPTNPIPSPLPSVTERTTQLIGVDRDTP